jgi:aminoglycoside N3'-acetyltransferase
MSPTVSGAKLVVDLRALGIAAGDVVFVHSSLSGIGKIYGGAETALRALLDVLTPEGTLIVPTYHMIGGNMEATCLAVDDYIFDPRTDPTELGEIPSAFLNFQGVKRSIHPTHSVSAVGREAEYVTGAHHTSPSALGQDSPWDRLVKLDGKVLGLGISMGPVTFYHMIEDMLPDEFPLPVKTQNIYHLKCRGWDGEILEVPVDPGNPELRKRRIDQLKRRDLRAFFWDEFSRAGLLTAGEIGGGRGWYIGARDFYDHLVTLMRAGITIYSTNEELKKYKPSR